MPVKSKLPVLDGVGPSCVRLPQGTWPTVLSFLQQHFSEIPAATWQARMDAGRVLDEDGVALDGTAHYRHGAAVFYYRELPEEAPIPFEAEIVHQDAHLLVADKPHFLPVIPSGRFVQETLLVRLKKRLGLDHLVPLHRIDRGTAGIILFSVNPSTRGLYQSLFPQRAVRKFYEAVAPALPQLTFPRVHRSRMQAAEPFFRMQEVAGPANSETYIDVREQRGPNWLYALQPVTGRKHQLRVHMAALGAPILGDDYYPEVRVDSDDDYAQPLQLLARAIEFKDPLSGATRRFESRRRL